MLKDTLFLLPPGFEDNDRREFCPECAEVWGLLSYFPAIKEAVEIVYVDIEHPREEITALLGEGRYNAPTLVFKDKVLFGDGVRLKTGGGYTYVDSARAIAAVFAERYGTPSRRGS